MSSAVPGGAGYSVSQDPVDSPCPRRRTLEPLSAWPRKVLNRIDLGLDFVSTVVIAPVHGSLILRGKEGKDSNSLRNVAIESIK